MRPCFRLTGLAAFVLLAAAACARAQTAAATSFNAPPPGAEAAAQNSGGPYGLEKGANEFGVWGGGSFSGPTLIGSTEATRMGMLAFRYARVLARGDSVALKYTVDAVPIATLSFPVRELVEAPPPFALVVREERRNITGVGLAPVGLQVNFRRRQRVQPFAQTSGGFLYFGERIPTAQGAQFNFTADFGGGVQWKTSARRAWTIGYRYHHVSNGYRAGVNPGFDSNLFYVGFSVFR